MGSTHKKLGKMADNNAKKAKVFGKLAKLISMEAKKAGGNLSSPGLKAAIEKARKENMPNDNIERAIKKTDGAEMTPILFEFYGPGGVGILATGLTDSVNRTSQEMRHLLDLHRTSLGGVGSVAWNFTKNTEGDWVANMKTSISEEDSEKLSALIDALEDRDDIQDVYTSAEQ
jgi:transcriptional/translational regulatory protein YebC/TACO1